jgi:hypothetical protein
MAHNAWVTHSEVAHATSANPLGPYTHEDVALPDREDGSNPKAHDSLMTSNPSICRRPDGRYLLVYKTVGMKRKLPAGGPVVHLVATATVLSGPMRLSRSSAGPRFLQRQAVGG